MANRNQKNRAFTDMSYLLDASAMELMEQPVKSANTETLVISELCAFKNHPFLVNTESPDFQDLVESIKENGIIVPIMVRPLGDKYEIIAGHRRVEAAKIAGLTEVPVIVRTLNDYEATVIMVHTNIAREKISHSEKARAYRMCHDIGKHQGKVGVDTAEEIGKEQNDSKRQVYRYIRLSYLCDDLLALVDAGKIAFNTGVLLGYLSEESQQELMVFIDNYKQYPSFEQAQILKGKENKGALSYEQIAVLLIAPIKEKPVTKVSFKTKDIANYFHDGTSAEDMSNTILMLLEKYCNGDFEGLL